MRRWAENFADGMIRTHETRSRVTIDRKLGRSDGRQGESPWTRLSGSRRGTSLV